MAMTNLEALKAQCKLICNTCYVDDDAARLALLNARLDEDDESIANDPDIIGAAITIVKGWVETSRSENGISVSTSTEALRKSIIYWCGVAGLDASGYVDDLKVIDNGSDLW